MCTIGSSELDFQTRELGGHIVQLRPGSSRVRNLFLQVTIPTMMDANREQQQKKKKLDSTLIDTIYAQPVRHS